MGSIIATLRGSLKRMQYRYAKGVHALHIVRWKRKRRHSTDQSERRGNMKWIPMHGERSKRLSTALRGTAERNKKSPSRDENMNGVIRQNLNVWVDVGVQVDAVWCGS